MRYSSDHKRQSRERILEEAGKVFRLKGYHKGGVDEIMKAAGLTHGGFYAHFKNKKALFSEVVGQAMRRSQQQFEDRVPQAKPMAWLEAWAQRYLSMEHRQHVDQGCPVPPLISEIPRLGEAPSETFSKALREWQKALASRLGGNAQAESLALAAITQSVGAIAIARSLNDPELAKQTLDAARNSVLDSFRRHLNIPPDPGASP